MAIYPRIDSPCPLRWSGMPGAAGVDCSQCHRHVHNLSAMSDSARAEFLAGCDDSVCVAYTVPRSHPRAAAAWVLAATVGMMAGSAVAQSTPPATLDEALAQMSDNSSADANSAKGLGGLESIVVGGVSDPRSVERVDFAIGPRAPELPVVMEDSDVQSAASTKIGDTIGDPR